MRRKNRAVYITKYFHIFLLGIWRFKHLIDILEGPNDVPGWCVCVFFSIGLLLVRFSGFFTKAVPPRFMCFCCITCLLEIHGIHRANFAKNLNQTQWTFFPLVIKMLSQKNSLATRWTMGLVINGVIYIY